MDTCAFELNQVSKWYRKDFWLPRMQAVVDVSLSVKRGRVTGFIGPNGAGKTTIIKMIMGLVNPDSGTIFLYGKKTGSPVSRVGIAYLSEQPYFYSHLTVEESLQFATDLLGIPRNDAESEIERVLSLVNLHDKNKTKVKDLSKGMQQRLNMAQSLLGHPHTLILDEPMSGMDPPGRRLFRTLFTQLALQDTTIFFSTHVLDDIEAVCDDVIVLANGKVSYNGSVLEILEKGFLGTDIAIAGRIDELSMELVQRGCTVSSETSDTSKIYVPAELSVDEIQRLLRKKELVYRSITERRMSLEELLYNSSVKESP